MPKEVTNKRYTGYEKSTVSVKTGGHGQTNEVWTREEIVDLVLYGNRVTN